MTGKRHYEFVEPKPGKNQKPPKSLKGHGYVYRVSWQRQTEAKKLRPKYKHFHTLEAAVRFWRLFGPAPWRYFRSPMQPNDRWPCRDCAEGNREIRRKDYATGREWTEEVGCETCFGGVSVRDYIRLRRLELPEIVWIRIERRPVGAWEGVEIEWEDEAGVTNGAALIRRESPEERARRLQEWAASETF